MRNATALIVVAVATACAHDPVCDRSASVQILGSGGPIPDDERASAGYVVWWQDRARVLVDAGGGTFERFARSGARIEQLDVIALTHLHTDHSADIPALLKGAFFSERQRDLPLLGPSGGGAFPGVQQWIDGTFGPKSGTYRYLSWLVEPDRGAFSLAVRELDATRRDIAPAVPIDDIAVRWTGVEHGPVPALAYRVDIGSRAVAFSGDLNGTNVHVAELARGADVLVMHHAVPEAADPVAARLHIRPSEIGRIAADAGVPHLVLSHHMQRSLDDLDAGLARIRSAYSGRITVADDLICVPLR